MSMFGGFDPRARKHEFFDRHRGPAIMVVLALYGAVYYASSQIELEPPEVEEKVVAVELAPSPVEEEPVEEIEEEPEEPPAPPPPNARKSSGPKKPAPKLETPTDLSEQDLQESDAAADGQAGGGGGGTGPAKPGGEATEQEKTPEPLPKKKAPPKRDPKKPTTLTRADKPAKKAPGNPQPRYPSAMQKRGIEGLVVVKITIDQKARLRKLKFIKVTNNATKESHIAKANEVMKKEVGRALSKWKFTEPCRHPDGQAFTCVMRERFPFKLKR
jgi:hypothetical protein